MTIRAATDATGFVDTETFAPFERWVLPNTREVWFRDSDHSYWRSVNSRAGEWCGHSRLAGTSTVAKVFDVGGGDGLLNWAAKLQSEGVAQLVTPDLDLPRNWSHEAYIEGLEWLRSGESIYDALSQAELTWRHIRDQAATRGSNVHREALQALATGSPVPDFNAMTDEERGYARGVIAFWHEHDPTPVLSEQVVADLDLGVAGRFDLVYTSRSGVRTLLDLKTTEVVPRDKKRPFYAPAHAIQLAGYSYLLERSSFEPCVAQAILYVDASGSYELVPGVAGEEDFLMGLRVYKRTAQIKADTRASLKEAA